MKLIKKQTRQPKGIPSITVSKKGTIALSAKAVHHLKLQDGDEIEFYQDADAPSDWYITPGVGVRLRKTNGGGLKANCSVVALDLLSCVPGSEAENSIRMPLSTQPIEGGYYAIITRRAI